MRANRGLNLIALIVLASVVLVGGQSALANEPPVAEAGLPRYAGAEAVRLDGTGSYDPDESGPLSYAWRQLSGPVVGITDASTAAPLISGPARTDPRGRKLPGPGSFVQTEDIQECEFELVVSDGELTSLPDTVKIIIVPTFTRCTMNLENAAFDPQKPTVICFGGGTADGSGGGLLSGLNANAPLWGEKANIISFLYVPDPAGANQPSRTYKGPADMVIVYLSAVAPEYRQPIQTMGFSMGGPPALDVARHLNLTYADARYAVNHVCLLDPSAWAIGITEYYRRVADLLAHPVDGEQCWVACHEAVNQSVCASALNVVFAADHPLPYYWYRESLATVEGNVFNHGLVAGAYWSVVGPGKNLQLALTPEAQTYKFRWTGTATVGELTFYDESANPGRLPEPVTLGAWASISKVSGRIDGAVLSCRYSENAVGYQLLFGSDPYRVMDFTIVSDTPAPPMEVIREFPSGETWWTIRVRDQCGSTIHADPIRLDVTTLPPGSVENALTGKRYGFISHAIRDANSGDVIVLDPGTYEESLEFSDKTVTVRSLDPSSPEVVAATVIKGWGDSPTVTFFGPESGGCVLAGLTIQNKTAGVSCRDAVPTIRNCIVECPDGIAIEFWIGHEPRLVDCTLLGQVKEGGDPGLIAYWKLDETAGAVASDSQGERDANAVGDPLWQPAAGKIGGAIRLDGIDDRLTAGFLLNPATGPFSVFAWVKGGAPGQVILSQTGGANWLMASSPDGVLMTDLRSGGRQAKSLTSGTVITDGTWHRVGFVRDGVNRILYVDDAEVARDNTQTTLTSATGGLYIGAGSTMSPASFWKGLIDDVRIYDWAAEP